jgi:hypothetical protein
MFGQAGRAVKCRAISALTQKAQAVGHQNNPSSETHHALSLTNGWVFKTFCSFYILFGVSDIFNTFQQPATPAEPAIGTPIFQIAWAGFGSWNLRQGLL